MMLTTPARLRATRKSVTTDATTPAPAHSVEVHLGCMLQGSLEVVHDALGHTRSRKPARGRPEN
jgi:hypothetical protein